MGENRLKSLTRLLNCWKMFCATKWSVLSMINVFCLPAVVVLISNLINELGWNPRKTSKKGKLNTWLNNQHCILLVTERSEEKKNEGSSSNDWNYKWHIQNCLPFHMELFFHSDVYQALPVGVYTEFNLNETIFSNM